MSDPAPTFIQSLMRLPLLGPVLRIAAGIVRLPRLREQAARMQVQLDELVTMREALATVRAEQQATAAQLAATRAVLDELGARHAALQATVQGMQADQDNLVQSMPVALRRITRELHALRGHPDGPPPDAR